MSNISNVGVRKAMPTGKVVLASFIIISMLAFVVASTLTFVYAQEAEPTVSTEATVEASPLIEQAEPTPEPTTEVSPEPSVEPTPLVVGEVETGITPEVTPEAIIDYEAAVDFDYSVDLVPSIEPTTTPEPTLEVTPESTPATSPVLATDKTEYYPEENVSIFGSLFNAFQNLVLKIVGGSLLNQDEIYSENLINVTADESGSFITNFKLSDLFTPLYRLFAQDENGNTLAETSLIDPLQTSFSQCSNNNPTAGSCNWIGSIIQQSNSIYYEGMTVPQRLLFRDAKVVNGSHTVSFTYQYTKAGIHAYDFLTTVDPNSGGAQGNGSFAPGTPVLNPCSDLGGPDGTACNNMNPSGTVPDYTVAVPNDSFDSKDASPTGQTDKENAYVTATGSSRNISVYVDGGTLSFGAVTLVHSPATADSDTGDTEVAVTIPFTTTGCSVGDGCDILFYFGGHLAVTGDGTGDSWGPGLGSSQISGGPYHIKTVKFDGTGGSQDNQIKGADILLPDPQGAISGVKFNDLDGDGVKDPEDVGLIGWTITLGGDGSATTVTASDGTYSFADLADGVYTVCETFQGGWVQTFPVIDSGTCADGNGYSITLSGGNFVTGQDFGNTQVAHLTLVKTLTKDNGGTASETDWTLSANGSTDISGTTGSGAVTGAPVLAGMYDLSETGGPAGYTPSDWVCVGGTQNDSDTVTLVPGDNVTCTISNNDDAPSLTLNKVVVNDEDGDASESDWTLSASGSTSLSGPGAAGSADVVSDATFDAGTYILNETGSPEGYTASGWVCTGTGTQVGNTIALDLGESAVCTITNNDSNVLPAIVVTKTAGVSSVNEPGGLVTYTFVVTNTSTVDAVTITSLTDNVFGSLVGDAGCQVGTILGVGAFCTFNATFFVTGNASDVHTNVFTATATDDEGSEASDDDDAIVTVTDVLPTVTLDKTVDVSTLPEPGGVFTYTLTIKNTSVEDVVITGLTDDNALSVECLALVGTTLTPGQEVSCTYTVTHTNAGTYPNTAKVTVVDDEDNAATGNDSETVKVVGARVLVGPLTATNNVGEAHTFTVLVEKNDGNGWVVAPGEDVDFTLTLVGTTPVIDAGLSTCDDAGVNTDVNGECTIVLNSATPGTVTVDAEVDVTINSVTMHRETDGTLGSSEEAVKTYIAGNIVVNKVVLGGDGSFDFDVDYDNDGFTLVGGGSNDSGYIATGLHSVVEDVPPGWYLTDISCVSSLGGSEDNTAIDLNNGETVTCTFTNVKIESLKVEKTAVTTYTRTFDWTIDKSVTPDTWDLFTGDSGISEYTVAVTKDDGTDSAWAVSGTITVINPNSDSDLSATVESVSDLVSNAGPMSVTCDQILPYSIPAGDMLNCAYSGSLPDGDNETNTATVVTSGLVPGGSGNADVTFGDPTTLVNDTVTVDDSNGSSWKFSDDGLETYQKVFTCGGENGYNGTGNLYNNTATIAGGDSDSALVTVNCYELSVTKDASTSLTRTWTWDVEKVGDQTALTLSPGQAYPVNYDVTVDATPQDSNWAVAGTITVTNPAPISATISGVTDVITGDVNAPVNCPSNIIPASSSMVCSYSSGLSDASDRTNTATVTLGNGASFTGTAPVSFSNAVVTEVDEQIDLTDSQYGNLGTVNAGDAPKLFEYVLNVGPYGDELCNTDQTYVNTATFTTNDEGITGSDSHTVNVRVQCVCSLTQGYWKTHNETFHGGAPTDWNWLNVTPNAESTGFFTVNGINTFPNIGPNPDIATFNWYNVFWTASKGNVYYNLAHQYMAAKLNVLNGAWSPTVSADILSAETLFSNPANTPTYVMTLKGKNGNTLRQQFTNLAGNLGAFNEGKTNPSGHCSETPVN